MEGKIKSESLRSNFIFNLIYQVIVVLTPLILTPKLSRIFQADYLGVKSFTFTIVYYFAVFGLLGLDMLGQRKIAIVKDDLEKRNKIFSTIFFTRFILVLFSTSLYVGYIFLFSSSDFEKIIFLCWLIYLFREMINPIWFLQGIEKYKILSILNIFSQIIYVIFTFVFIKTKDDLPLYIIFFTAIPLFISFCYFPFVFKNTRFVKFSFSDMKCSIKESFVYFVPTIATAIYSMVDKTMLGWFDTSKISTGLYEAAEKLVKVALAVSTASYTIMRTRMSYLYGQGDKEAYLSHCHKFMSFSMMLCWPIFFGIIGISKDFVPVFFGEGFEDVVLLSYVFAFVVPLLTISGLLQAVFIFPFGLQKTMDIYYVIIVLVNITFNALLIYLFGTIGAVISSLISEFLLTVILLIRARKDIDIKFLFTCSIKYLIASGTMLVVMIVFSKYVNLSFIIKVILEFIVGAATYFIICIILKDKFVLSNINTVFRKLFFKKERRNSNESN